MKKISLFCLLFVCIGLVSCKQNENRKKKLKAETPISVACYKALYENDTIELSINTFKSDKITGDMVMKIFGRAKKVGKIEGKFNGDTLYADYSFLSGSNEVPFKNPIAILKKGNELILGNGKIETYLGKSYFNKDTPIDFESVKYKFTSVDCID